VYAYDGSSGGKHTLAMGLLERLLKEGFAALSVPRRLRTE
jgi:hypothetical protein